MWRLDNDIALVTGAAGRLGKLWCAALRDAGATVVESDHPQVLGGFFGKSSAWQGNADITKEDEVRRIALEIESAYGRPTILVNNAGIDDRPGPGHYWPAYTKARDMVDVNLVGTYICTTIFGEWMAEAGRGTIINIASLYGLVAPDDKLYTHLANGGGTMGAERGGDRVGGEEAARFIRQFHKHPMYGATKAGIISLTKYFAALWGPKGVRVNALAPGGVIDSEDPLTGSDEEFRRKYTAKIPMGRMCRPEDLAGPLVFLASEASSFVSGQMLALDGGFTCW